MIGVRTQVVKIDPLVDVVDVATKVHRIFVIDCSGSMYGELPKVRSQLKNKLPQLTNIGDTVSLVWFSGRGEAGILQEAVAIRSLTDFTHLNSAIDKWIKPMCLTGFVDPLKLVNDIATKVRGTGFISMMLMTDGYDNQWKESEILAATKNLDVDAVTLVEFGYNCNRALMIKMAEEVGGALLFSESFEQYDVTFSELLSKPIRSGKKCSVTLDASAPLGYAVYRGEGDDIISVVVTDGKVLLPESVSSFSYVSDAPNKAFINEVYLVAYTTAQRMLGNETIELLGQTGDVKFIEMFCNCFSKQDYSEFQVEFKKAIFDYESRYVFGCDYNAVPKADAFTVLDLLDLLASDGGNLFHPNSDHFKYERIGVARDQKNATVSEDEKEAILEKMKLAKTKEELDIANKELTDLLAGKVEYKFIPDDEDGGYPIDMTFNETRPNVSIRVRVAGYIDIGTEHKGLPQQFATYIYRNYAMIKDGIKHSSMNCLPFELTEETFAIIQSQGMLVGETWEAGRVYLLEAKKLPVINRAMAQSISAKEFFEMSAELNIIQSEQKVYNTFFKNNFTKASEGFSMLYKAEDVEWLKSIGISEFNGFNPPSVKGEVKDVYIAKEFNVKIAKCSSIPTINEKLFDKIDKTPEKITLSESLCVASINICRARQATETPESFKEFLISKKAHTTSVVRSYILDIAKAKFTVVVGHVWFSEFASMDENTMKVKTLEWEFDCTAEVRDVEVEC